mmetsp:Transcript_43407/g.80872  ORF Transcript_43407/g.80872 Transcript_43407/m.80872 type:complete len:149 (-) Transcript_43407:98-544(-)
MASSMLRLVAARKFAATAAMTLARRPGPGTMPLPLTGRTLPFSLVRSFSSAAPLEDRIIAAVKRYIEARKDDLTRDNDVDTATREEILKGFDKDITTGTTWDDLNFDEVDKVEVLLEIEEEFNHVMPDTVADHLTSVQEVIEYLHPRV